MNAQEVPEWMIDASNVPQRTALQTLLEELPLGYTVRLDVRRGSSCAMLIRPFDDVHLVVTGRGIEDDAMEALRIASTREAESGASIDKVWKRFQAAMSKAVGK